MHMNVPCCLLNVWQRSCKLILSIIWIVGLLIGILTAAGAGDSFFYMMRGVIPSAVSIPGLLLISILPFLLTAFAFSLFRPLLMLVVLMKAFTFGFCAFGIMTVFADAGWLLRLLLMFSAGCSLPLLMWLWLRPESISRKRFLIETAVCIVAAGCFGFLDYYYVSPFAAMLL